MMTNLAEQIEELKALDDKIEQETRPTEIESLERQRWALIKKMQGE